MKPKETINLYRVISLLVIALVTFGVMGGLGAKSHLYPDEWLSMFFLTLIFLLVCMFELEYERKQKGISANTQTTFIRLSVTYTVSGGLIYAISYLPEFYRPVMIPVILLTAVSNSMVAVSFGLFFDLVLALTVGGSFYALAAYMMLTMLAAVLAQALKEKKYRMGVSLLTFFFSLMIPELFSYLSTKEMQKYSLLYAFGTAFLTFLPAAFLFHRLLHEADQEIENHLLDIVSEDYSEVKALKDFSMVEYRHAVKVSDIACRCAKEVGYRANLCLAGGFYYRMGRWIGEPYIKNAVNKAESLCFPAELISILAEYYGEEQLPSSPESALVHREMKIYFPEYKDALGKVDGAFSLELLKSAPFPADLKALDENGIRQIWHEAKLRGRGYSRSGEILGYARASVGIRDGADAARIAVQWFVKKVIERQKTEAR